MRGTLTVPSLELVGRPQTLEGPPTADVHVSAKDIAIAMNYRKGAFDLLLGETSFTIGELRAQDETGGAPLVVANLRMTGSLTEQSAQQLTGDVVVRADGISVGQRSGAGSLRVGLRNLDGAAVGQFQQWKQKLAGRPDDPQAFEELMTVLRTLLQGKPQILIETQARLTQGEWQATLTLDFQDFGEANLLQDPAALLNAIGKGLAEATASRALVESVLTDVTVEQVLTQAREQGEQLDEQALQGVAAMQTRQQLAQMVASGLLQLDGESYRATARFEGGKLFVSGQEVPLLPSAGEDDTAGDEQTPPEADGDARESTQR
jgi:uncharacterized protein YdgA (DUF945 family)